MSALVTFRYPPAGRSGVKLSFGIAVDEGHEYEGVDISECGLDDYPEFVIAE